VSTIFIFISARAHLYLLRRVLSAKTEVAFITVRQQIEILELRNSISRTLSELRQSQRTHMPGLAPILDEIHDDDNVEDSLKLWLPSELSDEERDSWCHSSLPALEFRFRYAQADDSLAELRRLRRLKQGLLDQNAKHNALSQKGITRSQGMFDGLQAKIRRCASRYSCAHDAMLALDPNQKSNPGWMERFQKLNDKDIRGPGRERDEPSEGQFTPSWIWLIPSSNHASASTPPNPSSGAKNALKKRSPPDDTDPLRVHWAKCQARAERYEEEVKLTIEEMGRTLRYFEWKKSGWLSLQSERATSDNPPPDDVQRGLDAYACRQANIYKTLVTSFAKKWRKTLASHGRNPDWLAGYPAAPDPPSPQQSSSGSQPGIEPTANSARRTSSSMDCDPPHPPFSPDDDSDGSVTSDMEVGDHNDCNSEGDYAVDEVEAFDADD
jgi:hypothetical protein